MTSTDSTFSARYQVLIVDDHPMFRDHLSQLLGRDLGLSVCGETDNVEDALRLIEEKKPDIAIVDISLRGASGLELLKSIKASGNPVSVLVLSMHDEKLYAERALRAGARGYISKNEASSEVLKAIRSVMAGEVYVSKPMTAELLTRITQSASTPELAGLDSLADRELEVFQWFGRGKNSREISEELGLSESTIDTYRSRIKEKLHLRSAAELYLRAGQWVKDHGI